MRKVVVSFMLAGLFAIGCSDTPEKKATATAPGAPIKPSLGPKSDTDNKKADDKKADDKKTDSTAPKGDTKSK